MPIAEKILPKRSAGGTVPPQRPRMKIFHLTSWLSNAGGGIPPVVEAIARELRESLSGQIAGNRVLKLVFKS